MSFKLGQVVWRQQTAWYKILKYPVSWKAFKVYEAYMKGIPQIFCTGNNSQVIMIFFISLWCLISWLKTFIFSSLTIYLSLITKQDLKIYPNKKKTKK